MNKKKLTILNLEISYLEKNENRAKTILCIHALGRSLAHYNQLFIDNRFGDYRIIAFDFPSHGNSSIGDKNVNAKYYSHITKKFIDTLRLRDIILLFRKLIWW